MHIATRLGLLATVVAVAMAFAGCSGSSAGQGDSSGVSGGLALGAILADAHAHSLMVDRDDPERLWLGVHGGLFRSDDGGRGWTLAGLEGEDAMNLAKGAGAAPLWVAGHEVLVRSADDGRSWEPVRPAGLPGLDLHGFAVRPGRVREIMAAMAGQGLFRSTDAGRSFALASRAVGPSVFGMTIAPDGSLFAADPQRGLLRSRDAGRSFQVLLQREGLVTVASSPRRPQVVLTGGEPGVMGSSDGGRTWSVRLGQGVAALAIAPSHPDRAYAVGTDAALYASRDGGRTWSGVQ